MGACSQCGNLYDKSFEVKTDGGETYVFDCFQCAVTKLAPHCRQCDCVMMGPGFETEHDVYYCCEHCAEQDGAVLENQVHSDRAKKQ